MTQVAFGSGTMIGVQTNVANPTPAAFGIIQSGEVDFNFSLKELYGQYQAPVAIARGALKISGKSSYARINAAAYNNLFFQQTLVTGTSGKLQVVNEAGTIPTTPYQLTVVNAATFQTDLGVFFAATGVQLTRVAASPATGQYSVNTATGVYTFAAADTAKAVLFNYTYNAASGANLITINNQLMGAAPQFQMNLGITYNSQVLNLQLNACIASKLSLPFKNQDFVINDFEFEAFADAAGIIGYITTSE